MSEYDTERAAAAAALSLQAAPLRITAAGKVFIDAYLDAFDGAPPAARKVLVQHIMETAAGREELGSASWTAQSVYSRLKVARKLRGVAVEL